MTIKEYITNEKKLLAESISKLTVKPTLTIIQVGDVEASNRYVRNKLKDAAEVGIDATLVKLKDDITTTGLTNLINLTQTDGIIVQLPLPKHIDVDEVMKSIPSEKDVDGFGVDSPFTPCTPGGIMDYLDSINFEFKGKHAVVIGRSEIVGKPMIKLLLDRDMTVSCCHSKTPTTLRDNLLREADLVVCAVGKHGVISSQKALNAFIVDVGINFNDEGKLVGDVEVSPLDKDRVTPVPGGVGLCTRLKLMKNVMEASKIEIKDRTV